MKFVCIECDEPMTFAKNGGMDEDGSLSVSFICPSCEWGVTLLTNPQETQMVRSLGVKIGGSTLPPQPMEMLQTHLAQPQGSALSGTAGMPSTGSSGSCPFSALVQDAYATTTPPTLHWSAAATERLERVPGFVRPMAQKGIEEFARQAGYSEITPEVMDAAREQSGF
jgi:hypothetical protein